MQFASLGRLQCICVAPRVRRPGVERRQVCRTCGLEASSQAKPVDRVLTAEEIRNVVKSLKVAGIRSAQYELPGTITTLRQLNSYLANESALTRKQPVAEPQVVAPSQAN